MTQRTPNNQPQSGLLRKLEELAVAAADKVIETSLSQHANEQPAHTPRVQWPDGTHTTLLNHQQGQCIYCAARIMPRTTQIDHLIPLARGGPNDFSNLQALCRPCNRRKGVHTDAEFRQRYATLISKTPRSMPHSYIPQSEFVAVTRQTSAPEAVQLIQSNRDYANSTKIRVGAIVAGVLTSVVTLITLSIFGITSIQPFLLGIVPAATIGTATTFAIISRAQNTGAWED